MMYTYTWDSYPCRSHLHQMGFQVSCVDSSFLKKIVLFFKYCLINCSFWAALKSTFWTITFQILAKNQATCNIKFSVNWTFLAARFRPPYHPGPQAMMAQVCIFLLSVHQREFCQGKVVVCYFPVKVAFFIPISKLINSILNKNKPKAYFAFILQSLMVCHWSKFWFLVGSKPMGTDELWAAKICNPETHFTGQ